MRNPSLWESIRYHVHEALDRLESGEDDGEEEIEQTDTLEKICLDLGECQRCTLAEHRHRVVFGEGNRCADLVVVGEAPGENEDMTGRPFVGKAGKKLDDALEKVLMLSRESVYICNVVKCRPQNNRDPFPRECEACLPFLRRQLDVIRPKILLVLGSVAHKILFETDEGVMRSRGQWRSWNGIDTMSTFHPAFLLRHMINDKTPTRQGQIYWKQAKEDLESVRSRYDLLGGAR